LRCSSEILLAGNLGGLAYNPLNENSLNAQKCTGLEKAALVASAIGRGQISLRLRKSIIDDYVLDILDGLR
jgi:hypothetical protein